jgi:gas vesicle protein
MFGAAVGLTTGLIFAEKSKNENTGNERVFKSEIKKKLGILLKSKSEFFD